MSMARLTPKQKPELFATLIFIFNHFHIPAMGNFFIAGMTHQASNQIKLTWLDLIMYPFIQFIGI